MAGSVARDVTWRCEQCGDEATYLTWVSVNLAEREDLREALADPDFWVRTCPSCHQLVERQVPLLILHLSPAAPLVFCADVETLTGDDPMGPSMGLVEEVRASLGGRADEIPGPPLLADFFITWVVSSRDLEADLRAPSEAAADAAASTEIEPEAYRAFLNEVDRVKRETDLRRALTAISGSTSVEAYRTVFGKHPVLGSNEAVIRLKENVAAAPDATGRRIRQAELDLVLAAQAGEFERGWEDFERYAAAIGEEFVSPKIDQLIASYTDAMSSDPAAAVPVAEELLGVAEAGHEANSVADARWRLASAFLFQPQADAASIDRAVRLLKSGLELLEGDEQADEALVARILIDLGAAFGRRRAGDVVANAERAAEFQRRALRLNLTSGERAIALTNLGHALVDRATFIRPTPDDPSRARDSRNRMLVDGIAALEEALELKSRERDPSDWAYTQINLGLAYARLDRGDTQDLRRALDHYDEAISGFVGPRDAEPLAYALRNRADVNARRIVLSESQEEREALAEGVRRDIEQAMSSGGWESNSFEGGRSLLLLARAQLAASGYDDEVVHTFRRAIEGLATDAVPGEVRDAGSQLATLAGEAGDWEVAAEASELAAEAAARAAEARAGRVGRFDEIFAAENLFRWTAYRLVRVERFERAVEILELGRARELDTWLQRDLQALAEVEYLDPTLARRFEECQTTLAEMDQPATGLESGTVDGAAVADELAAIKNQIRALPGLQNFLVHPGFSDLAAACRDGAAVVYPLTTPDGSSLVIVSGSPVRAEVIDCGGVTSAEIVRRLVVLNTAETEMVGGFLHALATPGPQLDDAITQLAELLGPTLLSPLASALEERGIDSVCLVPIGLLAYVPLHALTWPAGDGETCLLEHFDVSFAPSARARGVCLSRVRDSEPGGRFLIIGDPQPHSDPLPFAPTEIEAVLDVLGPANCDRLTGINATRPHVLGALNGPSLVHFACHGHSMVDPARLDAGLSLADNQELTAADFLELRGFAPRLVVASACQTGMISGYEIADEVLSLSTVIIGAGAAGVIASFWSVNDFATTVLMTKAYEGLSRGLHPARALRLAQLWARSLSLEDALEYVDTHPRLAADLRGPIQGAGETFDLSRPTFWAGFALNGA